MFDFSFTYPTTVLHNYLISPSRPSSKRTIPLTERLNIELCLRTLMSYRGTGVRSFPTHDTDSHGLDKVSHS